MNTDPIDIKTQPLEEDPWYKKPMPQWEFIKFKWQFADLQEEVGKWLKACFDWNGMYERQMNPKMRALRFYEEATELVQVLNITREQAHAQVDAVYDREVGDIEDEVGGATMGLIGICISCNVNWIAATTKQLKKIWGRIDKIRARQATKLQPEGL